MLRVYSVLLALVLVLGVSGPLTAHPFLTGYSGAPGTYGTCSVTCHGYPNGTLIILGFPDTSKHIGYKPDSTYTITIWHLPNKDTVENFNLSIRRGLTSVNAGLITAGFYTMTYKDSVETNGVQALGPCDSCNFHWTAPDTGTGMVKLYFGGSQGIEGEWDFNTIDTLVSMEYTGVEEQRSLRPAGDDFGLRLVGANPARSVVALDCRPGAKGPAQLRVYDILGRLVRSYSVSTSVILRWDGRDAQGVVQPTGVYLFRLEQGTRTSTAKALLIR
jgi:hypothetical protein